MRYLLLLAALAGEVFSLPAFADSIELLAPDDATLTSGWQPPPSPIAGLPSYKPVEAKDWLRLNRASSGGAIPGMEDKSKLSPTGGSMKNMPGMKDMHDMPGMGGAK